MIGSWFAGTIEAPGRARDATPTAASTSRAGAWRRRRRSRSGSAGSTRTSSPARTLFAEGISSSRIYLDPLRPGLEDLLDMITTGVRSSFTYAGAADPAQFHERAVVGVQSAAGYEEGKALPVSW